MCIVKSTSAIYQNLFVKNIIKFGRKTKQKYLIKLGFYL